MKISIVVPVFNEEKTIGACLKHLFDQEEQADEIIVIDNNCTDKSMEIVKKFPVKIVKQPVQGITPARNMGFDTALYPIIARTDADTRVPRNWIKRLKTKFKDKDVIAVSGPTRYYDVPQPFQISKIPMRLYFQSFKQIFQHECLFGMNMAMRKSVWKKVRKSVCTDDRIIHEDIDLSLHIAKYGRILFDYSLVVTSSPRRWHKIKSYIDQPYRYLKTIQHHHDGIIAFKQSKKIAKVIIPKTKKIISAITYSTLNL